ncbi:MAG: hypothetical protein LZF61_08560 [Nitrosomonas sp.]|nr:MAG: hypothetical protein LZF61_08560 [Nitrosomonas sp.]
MMPVANNQYGASPEPGTLQLLRKLAPPHTIIHIGAGTGAGEMHQWRQWDISNAYIIDADADRLGWAKNLAAGHPGWHALNATLAGTDDEIEFYQATNPDEDGFIPPEHLHTVWPNLQTTVHATRTARRLDHLLTETGGIIPAPWIFIDCLPALSILKGAGPHLDHCGVLWLRALLKPIAEVDGDATLSAAETFLQPLGFRCAEITESNHPAIGYAVFIRDWQATLQPRIDTLTQTLAQEHDRHARQQQQIETLNQANTVLTEEKSVLATQRDTLEKDLAALAQARNQYAQLATERQQQIESFNQANTALINEKSALTAQCDALKKNLAALTQAQDEHTRVTAERQHQLEALAQECDRHVRHATERQQQITALNQTNTTLTEEKSALAAQCDAQEKNLAALIQAQDEHTRVAAEHLHQLEVLAQQRDHHAQLAAERQQQIETLNQANTALTEEKSALATRRATLEKHLATLIQTRDEHIKVSTQCKAELEQLQAQLKQKDARITQLEADGAELDTRQRLLNDEMTRAEAQIDLIKDVLLREPGL